MTRSDFAYLLGAMVMFGAAMLVWNQPSLVKSRASYSRVRAFEGRAMPFVVVASDSGERPDTLHFGDGIDRLVYFMSTGCPYCASQHASLRRDFARIGSANVLTLAQEPSAITRNYWNDPRLAAPVQLLGIPGLRIRGVPLILCVDANGRIKKALSGLFADQVVGEVWSPSGQRCA